MRALGQVLRGKFNDAYQTGIESREFKNALRKLDMSKLDSEDITIEKLSK